MNLAIQHIKRQIAEHEVQLEQKQEAYRNTQKQADAIAADVQRTQALLADLRAAVAALPVAKLEAVPAEAKQAKKR